MLTKEAVVIAFAATDAVALAVEGHTRYDNEVEITGVRLVLWFKDIEVAYDEIGVLGVFHRDDVIADHSGQDDGFLQMPFFKESLRLHLVGQGTVQHDSIGFDEVGMLFQLGQDFLGLFHQLFLGVLFLQGFDVCAKFFFLHFVENLGKSKKQSRKKWSQSLKTVFLHPKIIVAMKRLFVILLLFIGCLGISSAQEHRRYALVWHDEFDSGTLDETVWSKIPRSNAGWAAHMTSDERLYGFEDGNLVLRGMVNDILPKDKAEYLTGGVWSKYKKKFGFGRIEVRAKFDVAQGYWPAIWMLPQSTKTVNWPHGGEIDIMEHFGESPYVNHTVHSHYTYNLRKRSRPPHVAYPKYNGGQYNVYGMERFQDSLVFSVNGRRSMNYPRYRKGANDQFPFSQHDYYLILDAQLGNDGSPSIDRSKLPVELRIDYVRFYEVDTKTDVIPEPKEFEQLTSRKYKFKKMKVDEREVFNNPDEYRLVVKRGKAKVSGNVNWAQATLEQLIDEQGRISNLEVHDWATCPSRGIVLDLKASPFSFNDLIDVLDLMSFYKLNCLVCDIGNGFSDEEVNQLRKHASDLGIQLANGSRAVSAVDVINLEGKSQYPALNQVFLRTAAKKGGNLQFDKLGVEEKEAVMAFSERYWRGGDAGAVEKGKYQPDALSPAGSRLANFKEKVAVHKRRFSNK